MMESCSHFGSQICIETKLKTHDDNKVLGTQ